MVEGLGGVCGLLVYVAVLMKEFQTYCTLQIFCSSSETGFRWSIVITLVDRVCMLMSMCKLIGMYMYVEVECHWL